MPKVSPNPTDRSRHDPVGAKYVDADPARGGRLLPDDHAFMDYGDHRDKPTSISERALGCCRLPIRSTETGYMAVEHQAPIGSFFSNFARWCEQQVGRPATFVIATLIVIAWAATGPIFSWSDTWQLVVNTLSSVVTFLMVFVIQYTQNRDTRAIQLKLDELIRVNQEARNALIGVEKKPDPEVDKLEEQELRIRNEQSEVINSE